MSLDLSNIITVTLVNALKGLSVINTSALALFTDEVPVNSGYGTYGIYRNPQGVANDFGSNSVTYQLALDVFSQNPNIISGGGYLVVIPLLQAAAAQPATILGSAPVNFLNLTATDYAIKAAVDGAGAASLVIGKLDLDDLASLTASLNSSEVEGAGLVFTVSGTLANALVTLSTTATGGSAAITISPDSSGTDNAPFLNMAGASATGKASGLERVKDAVLRTYGSIPYFGILVTNYPSNSDLEELAATIQTMNKLLFVASATEDDIAGVFTTLMSDGMTHTRCLYYSVGEAEALSFAAAYAGRGLSINFNAANTALTMHLKPLVGINADEGVTQNILTACGNAGVDVYADFGIPETFTSGANMFFDQIYTELAFSTQIQIAGFNYLATTSTKIPQTEPGMSGLKAALRTVCKQFVTAGVFAPGTWTEPPAFGDPTDFVNNIAAAGFYIYSDPIASQTQAERNVRVAPAVYIAAKDAGAIHSANILVYVEA